MKTSVLFLMLLVSVTSFAAPNGVIYCGITENFERGSSTSHKVQALVETSNFQWMSFQVYSQTMRVQAKSDPKAACGYSLGEICSGDGSSEVCSTQTDLTAYPKGYGAQAGESIEISCKIECN